MQNYRLYLICRLYRVGQLEQGKSDATKSAGGFALPGMSSLLGGSKEMTAKEYRRPYGCAVLPLSTNRGKLSEREWDPSDNLKIYTMKRAELMEEAVEAKAASAQAGRARRATLA